MTFEHDLKAAVRTIPDYPKPGILFRDITTLLGDARSFRRAVDELVQPWAGNKIDKVAGIEARGFILGGAVAHQLSAGFVSANVAQALLAMTHSLNSSLISHAKPEGILDDTEAHLAAKRHQRFRMELHATDGQGLVLDRHRDAVLGTRGHRQHLGHAIALDIERMIAADHDLIG